MKKLLTVFTVFVFISCGNGGSATEQNAGSPAPDTTASGPVIIADSTGSGSMNADTTGMGQAR